MEEEEASDQRRCSSLPVFSRVCCPLFTEVRGRGILRSPYPRSRIAPPLTQAGESLLPCPSTGGRPQDVGVLANYALRCKYQNTKHLELRFHAVLGDGAREVRFERATVS